MAASEGGVRHSDVRIFVPTGKAPEPTRLTCRYLRVSKLANPELCEGEVLACPILEMTPAGVNFPSPVILEVPHSASLRGGQREIVILRHDDGQNWTEHNLEAADDVLQDSFSPQELSQVQDVDTTSITRILTCDFPHYFALVTRIRHDVLAVGPGGGTIASTVAPQVQVVFPEGCITKTVKVAVEVQPVANELVQRLHGDRLAVSPVVTVAPMGNPAGVYSSRKFHKPITLCIPRPQRCIQRGEQNTGCCSLLCSMSADDMSTERVLFSISRGTAPAQWEDVTEEFPSAISGDIGSAFLETSVSGRFWLVDCQTPGDAVSMAQQVYSDLMRELSLTSGSTQPNYDNMSIASAEYMPLIKNYPSLNDPEPEKTPSAPPRELAMRSTTVPGSSCRAGSLRIIVPKQPTRLTCRYLRVSKLANPPPLCEGEVLASPILEMTPAGANFPSPVVLEVPHSASLRGGQREIVILRYDDGQNWTEHKLEDTEDAQQDVETTKIARIVTSDFPQYFALVARVRRDVQAVGPGGSRIVSTVVPQVQVVFPEGCITKTVKVAVEVQPVANELVQRLHRDRLAVSPVVTVAPMGDTAGVHFPRKFYKPITLCIPLPQSSQKNILADMPTVQLLFSFTRGTAPAEWEDISDIGSASLETTVSGRFWLVDCQTPRDAVYMAQQVYSDLMREFSLTGGSTQPSDDNMSVASAEYMPLIKNYPSLNDPENHPTPPPRELATPITTVPKYEGIREGDIAEGTIADAPSPPPPYNTIAQGGTAGGDPVNVSLPISADDKDKALRDLDVELADLKA